MRPGLGRRPSRATSGARASALLLAGAFFAAACAPATETRVVATRLSIASSADRESQRMHRREARDLHVGLATDSLVLVDPGHTVRFDRLGLPERADLDVDLLLRGTTVVPESVEIEAKLGLGEGGSEAVRRSLAWEPGGLPWLTCELELEASSWIDSIELTVNFPGSELGEQARLALVRPFVEFERPVEVPAKDAPRPRQVVLVTLDTFRADAMGCYGNERVATPELDAFAAESALFEDCYAPANVTKPSHTSIFTGLSPLDHGVTANDRTLGDSTPTLVDALREEGFATGAFPAAVVFRANRSEFSDRFEDYVDFGNQQRRAEDVNNAVFPWLERHAASDFFAWIHYFDAHTMYDPPPPFDRMYWDEEEFGGLPPKGFDPRYDWDAKPKRDDVDQFRALYDGEVSYLDRELGELFDHLRALDILEHGLVIVTADHGEAFGELGQYGGHGELSDATTHIPLLIRPPGGTSKRLDGLVSTTDLYPTIFDYLGLEVRTPVRGTTLRPAIERDLPLERDAVLSVHAGKLSLSLRSATDRFTLGLDKGTPRHHYGADGGHRVWFLKPGQTELYDYTVSDVETENLARTSPLVDRRRTQLDALVDEALGYAAQRLEGAEVEAELRALGYVE